MHPPSLWSMAACFVLSQCKDAHHHGIVATVPMSPRTSSSIGLAGIEDISVETPADNYDRLLEWLRENDAEVNDNLCFRPSSLGGGFGAFVTGDVEKDEVLVTIPRKIKSGATVLVASLSTPSSLTKNLEIDGEG